MLGTSSLLWTRKILPSSLVPTTRGAEWEEPLRGRRSLFRPSAGAFPQGRDSGCSFSNSSFLPGCAAAQPAAAAAALRHREGAISLGPRLGVGRQPLSSRLRRPLPSPRVGGGAFKGRGAAVRAAAAPLALSGSLSQAGDRDAACPLEAARERPGETNGEALRWTA